MKVIKLKKKRRKADYKFRVVHKFIAACTFSAPVEESL